MTSENTQALPTVGLIGLGNLGNPMAVSALSHGYPMVVHSLNKAEAENLIALGATWANSAAEVGNKSDVVITVLPAPHHVRDIMIGSSGVLQQIKPGSTFIDKSTSSVEVANEIKELADPISPPPSEYITKNVGPVANELAPYIRAPSGPIIPSTARGPNTSSRLPVATAPIPEIKCASPKVSPSVLADTP